MSHTEVDGKWIAYPEIQMIDGELTKLEGSAALEKALETGNFIEFPTKTEAADYAEDGYKTEKFNEVVKRNEAEIETEGEDMSLSGLDITLAEEDIFENDTLTTISIKGREGFLSKPVWDNRQWTWGYGTEAPLPKDRNAEVPTDLNITREKANEELHGYLDREIINKLNDYSEKHNYNWNNTQKEGLTSFLYNLGYGKIHQLTDNGTRTDEEIAEKMLEYNKAPNEETGELEVVEGLTKRRIEESNYFRRGMN